MEIWHGERGFVEEGNIEEIWKFLEWMVYYCFNGPYSVSLCKYIERDWKNFLCFIKCGVGAGPNSNFGTKNGMVISF